MTEEALRAQLRAEAILLLQRERELIELRKVRRRTERWLRAFHELSLRFDRGDGSDLVLTWAHLVAGELSFERAGALEVDRASGRVTRATFDPEAAQPPDPLPAEALAFLEEQPTGTFAAGAAVAPRELGRALGLESFFWLWQRPGGGDGLLLVAGYSARAAAFHSLPEHDHSHFLLLGNHLGALLASSRLVAEVTRERLELATANHELDASVRDLREAQRLLIDSSRALESEMRERVRVEAELHHAQKLDALGRMAAGLAHEVNSPLTAVVGNVDLAREELGRLDGPDGGEARSALAVALAEAAASADRVARILHDVTTFATRKAEPAGAVELAPVVETALRLAGNLMRHHARLVERVDPVPRVVGERLGLEHVLVNLLTNASQAMPAGRLGDNRVELVVQRGGEGEVIVEVRDNGVGIAPGDLGRVFDPFFTTREVGQGMGLGLSVCRGILEGFGARITIESERGQGTVARVHLRAAPEGPAAAAAGAPVRGDLSAARVLVVDDEPAILRLLERGLGRHRIEAVTCGGGRQAIERYRSGRFDLVLCDLMMPDVNGMDLHAALAALGPEHEAKVVFMSGGIFSEDVSEFLQRTPVRVLQKPCRLEEVVELVAEAVEGKAG